MLSQWTHFNGRQLQHVFKDILDFLVEKDIKYVFVDAWQAAFGGDADSPEQIRRVYQKLNRLATEGGERVVVVLDHVSKPHDDQGPGTTAYGSVYKENYARCINLIERSDIEGTSVMTWKNKRNSVAPESGPFRFYREDDESREATSLIRTGAEPSPTKAPQRTVHAEVTRCLDSVLRDTARRNDWLSINDLFKRVRTLTRRGADTTVQKYIRDALRDRMDVEHRNLPAPGSPILYRLDLQVPATPAKA